MSNDNHNNSEQNNKMLGAETTNINSNLNNNYTIPQNLTMEEFICK